MNQSNIREFNWKGRPARMAVIRNNGVCYGQLHQENAVYLVSTRRDYYERNDDDAARALIRAARREANVTLYAKLEPPADQLLKTVEQVLYLALLHNDFRSLPELLADVQRHNGNPT